MSSHARARVLVSKHAPLLEEENEMNDIVALNLAFSCGLEVVLLLRRMLVSVNGLSQIEDPILSLVPGRRGGGAGLPVAGRGVFR